MYEIIQNFLNMAANLINSIFEFEIEWNPGQMVAIGKLAVAFVFIVFAIHSIMDALGLLDEEE